mmetsp:Transcript_16747/g.14649  ORF Transcript_16747/g.14649 Transcript_16747/m.14649 type:complete len:289 (-) Transcript_16747:67-933(-)
MSLVPIFQDIFEKNYESAIEDLGEKIPELESEWDECDVYNAAFLDKVLIPIYDQFEENPEETLETLGLNLLENFNTLKSDFNLIKSDIESMKFYDAGLKEGSLITTLFNGIIPKNNYTTFFDIEASNYTTPNSQVFWSGSDFESAFVKGFADELGLHVTNNTVADYVNGTSDLFERVLFPMIEAFHYGRYEEFVEDLVEDVPRMKEDLDEAHPYTKELYTHILKPVYDSFKDEPVKTTETVGMNVIENLADIKADTKDIYLDQVRLKPYEAGQQYGKIFKIVFDGIIN